MRRPVHVYGFIQTFSMHHKYTDTNVTFIRQTPPPPSLMTPLRGAPWPGERRTAPSADASAELLGLWWSCLRRSTTNAGARPCERLPASQRPPGGCPAAPAPRTRMFGLENDFPTPSAPFSNCPRGNYLVSFPLKKTQELWCFFSWQTKTKLCFLSQQE